MQTSHPLPSCQCAGAVLLTERQVHNLVILLFPEWLSISQTIQLENLDRKTLSESCVYHTVGLRVQWVMVLLLSLSLPPLPCVSTASWEQNRDLSASKTWVTQHFCELVPALPIVILFSSLQHKPFSLVDSILSTSSCDPGEVSMGSHPE